MEVLVNVALTGKQFLSNATLNEGVCACNCTANAVRHTSSRLKCFFAMSSCVGNNRFGLFFEFWWVKSRIFLKQIKKRLKNEKDLGQNQLLFYGSERLAEPKNKRKNKLNNSTY